MSTYQLLISMFHDAGLFDHVILMATDMLSFGIELDEICMNYANSAYVKLQGLTREFSLDGHRTNAGHIHPDICIYHPAIMIIANYSCSPYMRASITVLNNLYLGQRPQQKVIMSLLSGTRTLHQTPLFEDVIYCRTNLCRRFHHSDTSILQCTYFVLCSSFPPCYYSCELQERKLYT